MINWFSETHDVIENDKFIEKTWKGVVSEKTSGTHAQAHTTTILRKKLVARKEGAKVCFLMFLI